MTREEARKAAEVMLAYAEGKEIEYKIYNDNLWYEVIGNNPVFNWNRYDYRVKHKPKYRPFKDKEECWNEMLKHQPFGWLEAKDSKKGAALIGKVYMSKDVWIVWATDDRSLYSASDLFKSFTFSDGTPFGIKED